MSKEELELNQITEELQREMIRHFRLLKMQSNSKKIEIKNKEIIILKMLSSRQ